MKIIFALFLFAVTLFGENNITSDSNKSKLDNNNSLINANIQKEIEKEKKYKKEQKFYMGKDYNLTEEEVDKKTLDKVPVIEPEYDFDITDLYSD